MKGKKMIPKEYVSGDYRCPKCDRYRSSTDVNNYEVDGKDHTRIKLACTKCRTYVGTVDIWEPAKVAPKEVESKSVLKRREIQSRKNMSVGVGNLSVPEK